MHKKTIHAQNNQQSYSEYHKVISWHSEYQNNQKVNQHLLCSLCSMVYTTTSSMIGDRAREERKQQPGPRTYSLFELRTAFRISTWGVYRRKTLPSARTALVLEERKSSLFFYIFNSQWWYPPNVTNNFRCRPLQPIATALLVLTDNNKNILLFILGELFFSNVF